MSVNKPKVKTEKTKDVKVARPNELKSHEVLTDSLKRKKIKLFLYKGIPVASKELTETDVSYKKLRLVRIKVDFMQLSNNVSIDMLVVKDNIEHIDIDLSYIELFLKRHFDQWAVNKILTPIIEKHDAFPYGALVGVLVLPYHQYLDFVNFIEYMLHEPLKNDRCI